MTRQVDFDVRRTTDSPRSFWGWRPSLLGWNPLLLEVGGHIALGLEAVALIGGWKPSILCWRPSLLGWRPLLLPSLVGWSRLETLGDIKEIDW